MSEAGASAVTWSSAGPLATIRLAREHGNAIDSRLIEDLRRALRELEADPSIRGALLASSGKIFCPGLDLMDLQAYERAGMAEFLARFSAALLELYTFSKPLVAALSGAALAGGCVLALTADWRVLRRGAPIGLNEIGVGLPLPFGVAHLLAASVSPMHLEEVALFGRNYSDEEAVRAGLVHELCDAPGLEEHCLMRLEELASKDPIAFARTKQYLRSATAERIRARDQAHAEEFLDCWFSPATKARVEEIVAGLKSRRG